MCVSSNSVNVSIVHSQAQPIEVEMVRRILGNKATFGPIITLEPRRRKFHKPITMTLPVPKNSSNEAMPRGYGGDMPTLRLLCSITGGLLTPPMGHIVLLRTHILLLQATLCYCIHTHTSPTGHIVLLHMHPNSPYRLHCVTAHTPLPAYLCTLP